MYAVYILLFSCLALTNGAALEQPPVVGGSNVGVGVASSVGQATAIGNAQISVTSGVSTGGSGSANEWQTTDLANNINSHGSGSSGSGYGSAWGTVTATGDAATGSIENVAYGVGSGQETGHRKGRWFYPYYGGYYGYYNYPYYTYGKK